ncbi:putative aflatoxin efflux pump [Dendryphion nanum]|uniref:Aflatoxin efflux pump n=1 Tax=Dendryphion nanum TaxID=256645 RepID=A0A9P9IYJ1_9PLEO|nr:putative aflatoxin efflux pump [Dendryphion nanum]
MSPIAEDASRASVHSTNQIDPTPSTSEYDDAERNYQPKTFKFWAIMISMYLSIFLIALDRTIIAVAIPEISNQFHSIEDIGWYGSSYMLTAACFNPFFGRIYQIYSTKWTFIASITIFEVGSVLCGAAPNSPTFIIGRAIAGLGAAGVFSGGMMIIIPLIPLRKRPTYTAIFGMAFGVSSVVGPLVGGALTDNVTWRWCFYINLPIGGVTMIAILMFLNIPSPKRERVTILGQIKRLDPIGLLVFVPCIVCLILALSWGGTTYAWSEPKIIGLLVTFAVLLVVFIIFEAMTPETAMMPARVVLNRSVAGSMLFTFLSYGGVMAIVYYLATWFQVVKNDSATAAGVKTIPLVLAMVVFSIISAKITERIGYYIPAMLLSPILSAAGAGMLSTMTRFSDHNAWIGYQVLFGFGLGCGAQQASLAPQKVLSRSDVPIGMALMFFMQQLGGSVFLAVGQNIFSTDLIEHLAGVANLDARAVVNTGATEIRKLVPPVELDLVVDAFNHAITRVFLVAAVVSAVMIVGPAMMEWKSIKDDSKDEGASKTDDVEEKFQNDSKA